MIRMLRMLKNLIYRWFRRCEICNPSKDTGRITKKVGKPYPDIFRGSKVEITVRKLRHSPHCDKPMQVP